MTYIGTGIVFSAGLDEVILALTIADGTEVFRYQETAGINAQATVSGDNIYFPAGGPLIASSNTVEPPTWRRFVEQYVVDQSSWVHIALYFLMIIFFTYFYVAITFNPDERADDMKKFGGFIPGIRPGRPTAEYLRYVLSRITLPGSIYLGIIAVLPNFFLDITGQGNNQNFPFGGTAVLIMVGVGLDTVKQIESQLMQRNYEGFLR